MWEIGGFWRGRKDYIRPPQKRIGRVGNCQMGFCLWRTCNVWKMNLFVCLFFVCYWRDISTYCRGTGDVRDRPIPLLGWEFKDFYW